MTPLLLYVSIAAVVVGSAGGWVVRDWKADSDSLAMQVKNEKIVEQLRAKVDSNATAYEDMRSTIEPNRVETRNTIREIYRNVEVPTVCAPPESVTSLLNAARLRANSAATGEPSGELPGNKPAAKPPSRP